jgi:hypothetical protein
LEVAEVLLAESGFLINLDIGAAEGRRIGLIGSEGRKNTLRGFTSAAIWRGEEVEGVVGTEQISETATGVVGLVPALGGEFDSMIRNGLVDVPVLCRGGWSIWRWDMNGELY